VKKNLTAILIILLCGILFTASCQEKKVMSATVPIILDHNRMLVDAEIQRPDGSWRMARLWVDTGNPDFFISESLAIDLGLEIPANKENFEAPPPAGVKIGGMTLDFSDVVSNVMIQPKWLFSTMHNDANLPSTVMKKYQVVFDYPAGQFTIAQPGSIEHRGTRVPLDLNPVTGIIQIDAIIAGDSFSFAMDNGASYSFISEGIVTRFNQEHPDWPHGNGALGCANIWGWWPQEAAWPVMRLPELSWGQVHLEDVGVVGLPKIFGNVGIETWYSKKTARPVNGFLGPNAFKAFRVEIDYPNKTAYFEKGADFDSHDMDIVGLTLRQEPDNSYTVVGVAVRDGKPAVDDVQAGDKIIQIGNLKTTGATMGTVIDALRGKPGDARHLVLERDGRQFSIDAKVERFL
jgi:hypothetical protein